MPSQTGRELSYLRIHAASCSARRRVIRLSLGWRSRLAGRRPSAALLGHPRHLLYAHRSEGMEKPDQPQSLPSSTIPARSSLLLASLPFLLLVPTSSAWQLNGTLPSKRSGTLYKGADRSDFLVSLMFSSYARRLASHIPVGEGGAEAALGSPTALFDKITHL